MPVSQALVRLPTITRRQYDTAFTLSLLRGGLLTLVLLLIALPFSSFYGDHRLALLVAVLSIGSTARGLVSPRLARFQKSMSFWRDFTLELGGKVVAFAASTTVALATGSYWALAFGTVIFPIAAMIGSYILAPYRPRLSLAELPVFTGFIGWFSVAQVINSVNWQFERLLLGQLMSTARLGLFTASSDVASIPFMSLFTPVLRPLLAAFSQVHSDRPRLKQSYMSASNAVVAIGLPLLVGEALAADPAVRLILGEKWLDAVPLVQWLALSLIPALIAMPAIPLVMAVGQTRLFVYRSLLEFSVKLPVAIAGAIQFGFFGIIAARFLSEVVTGTYCIVWVKQPAADRHRRRFHLRRCAAGSVACLRPPPWHRGDGGQRRCESPGATRHDRDGAHRTLVSIKD
jgi:PST family polysaccharide transporter